MATMVNGRVSPDQTIHRPVENFKLNHYLCYYLHGAMFTMELVNHYPLKKNASDTPPSETTNQIFAFKLTKKCSS